MNTSPEPAARGPEPADSAPLDPALPGIKALAGIAATRRGGYAVTVHISAARHPGSGPLLSIEIRAAWAITEPLTVCIDQRYLDSLGALRCSPAAQAESGDGTYRILDFPAPRAPSCRIDISGSAAGSGIPPGTADLHVYAGGIHVASIDLPGGRAP